MSLLHAAKRVRIVTVDEPAKLEAGKAAERLARHLTAHGVDAFYETIESKMSPIRERLMAHAQEKR